MYHKYYSKSSLEQTQIQLRIVIIALLFNLTVVALSVFSGLYFFIFLSIAITLSIIAPFFDVPTLKKKGELVYYSSLFTAEKERNGIIRIHGGSLFDYVFVIDRTLSGKQRTSFILQQYLEGILNLVGAYENRQDTAVKIKATTYILNERTANKIGLKMVKTDFSQKLILIYNYVNIFISNSIAKERLSFPKITTINTFEGEIDKLAEQKELISKLNNKLKKTIAHRACY